MGGAADCECREEHTCHLVELRSSGNICTCTATFLHVNKGSHERKVTASRGTCCQGKERNETQGGLFANGRGVLCLLTFEIILTKCIHLNSMELLGGFVFAFSFFCMSDWRRGYKLVQLLVPVSEIRG